MNIEQEMDWIENSKEINDLEIEICFQLQESFYTGDLNNYEQLQDKKYHEAIEMPSFGRVVETMARTSEVIDSQEELVSYYKTVIEKSQALNKPFNEIKQYFWLRLWFWNTGEDVHISFPWYDSLSEIQKFFSWLRSNPEQDYVDMDQGWQIEAVRSGNRLHIRQTDPDDGEEYANISVPFAVFLEKSIEVEARALTIIGTLSSNIGVDVWSKYLQDAKFGTSEWQPNKKLNRTKKADGFFRRLFKR
ncbi:hypothetical protein [Neptunomonas phycophila]|uniref:hypothetical protein n=1 Tax=Neptunomonas phycophila TaxID=1572645 RepID=UPI0015BCFE77|nr:hypothetical protein [Neptunomonas phycophila]QLE98257.1 hypothetical protein FLM49_11740 [Neptunomonas phycophila]